MPVTALGIPQLLHHISVNTVVKDKEVDYKGTHGLSYRHSKGRHHRHASVIHGDLTTAKIPSWLEQI